MSDAIKIIISVFGSALTVSVALAALTLTSSSHTRRQFSEQIDLVRRYSDSQFGRAPDTVRPLAMEAPNEAPMVAGSPFSRRVATCALKDVPLSSVPSASLAETRSPFPIETTAESGPMDGVS